MAVTEREINQTSIGLNLGQVSIGELTRIFGCETVTQFFAERQSQRLNNGGISEEERFWLGALNAYLADPINNQSVGDWRLDFLLGANEVQELSPLIENLLDYEWDEALNSQKPTEVSTAVESICELVGVQKNQGWITGGILLKPKIEGETGNIKLSDFRTASKSERRNTFSQTRWWLESVGHILPIRKFGKISPDHRVTEIYFSKNTTEQTYSLGLGLRNESYNLLTPRDLCVSIEYRPKNAVRKFLLCVSNNDHQLSTPLPHNQLRMVNKVAEDIHHLADIAIASGECDFKIVDIEQVMRDTPPRPEKKRKPYKF